MATTERTRTKSQISKKVKLEWPIWYDPNSPLGSAVRYLASYSPKFGWVGVYSLRKDTLELGPCLGKVVGGVFSAPQVPIAPPEHIALGQGICGTAILERKDQSLAFESHSELVVLIRNQKGKMFGLFHLTSPFEKAFGIEEELLVRQIAQELGDLWPVK